MPPVNPTEFLLQAFRLEQLGLFSEALAKYRETLAVQPENFTAAHRHLRLLRDMRSQAPDGVKLVWQVDPGQYCETDWVRYLLSALECTEIIDGKHAEFHDGAIIVDNKIGSWRPYYFEMLKRGHRFALIHLSDEHYTDDTTVYNFANFVLRNYWSRGHAGNRNVIAIPLGFTAGFHVDQRRRAGERNHLWCFAGNIVKTSRLAMMSALSRVEGGHVHGTNRVNVRSAAPGEDAGFVAPLDIGEYARLMADSVFAPCPAGWENLDSFRVCEALEAGCIPIVERRPSFDYFRHLFGDHPFLTVTEWNEAPAMIAALVEDRDSLNRRQAACGDWWRAHKASLVQQIRDFVVTGFSTSV